MSPARRQQEQNNLAPILTETFQSLREVYGFHCSSGLEQGLDERVESLEHHTRELEMLAWRLRLLGEWILLRGNGPVSRQERMSSVQAGASKETKYSFGRTLS